MPWRRGRACRKIPSVSTTLAMMGLRSEGASLFARFNSFSRYRPFRIDPGSGAQHGYPLVSRWDSNRAVKEGLKMSAVLAALIGRLAEKGASVPWWEWRREKSGRVKRHKMLEWMEAPRADGKIDRSQMMEAAITHMVLNGNALFGIWWEGRRRFRIRPRELQVENPHGCAPIPDRKKWISGYEWDDTAIGGPRAWDADDIVHVIGRPDPTNPYWGWSIVEALATTVDADIAARRMNLKRFLRGGYPGMIITDEDVDTGRSRRELEESLNSRAESYMGAFMVLGGKQKVERQSPLTETQLGLFKAMAHHRDEIAVALGVHPSIFSTDASTMNNMQVSRVEEWKNVVMKVMRIANAFTSKLVPRNKVGEIWYGPDYSGVEELEDIDSKIDRMVKLVSEAQVSVDDAARIVELHLPSQSGGDEPWVQGGWLPKSVALQQAPDQSNGADSAASGPLRLGGKDS